MQKRVLEEGLECHLEISSYGIIDRKVSARMREDRYFD